jgi:hypothetical protein
MDFSFQNNMVLHMQYTLIGVKKLKQVKIKVYTFRLFMKDNLSQLHNSEQYVYGNGLPHSWGKTFDYKENAVLSGYITTLKNKQKLDVSSEGPSSRVSRAFARNVEFLLIF